MVSPVVFTMVSTIATPPTPGAAKRLVQELMLLRHGRRFRRGGSLGANQGSRALLGVMVNNDESPTMTTKNKA